MSRIAFALVAALVGTGLFATGCGAGTADPPVPAAETAADVSEPTAGEPVESGPPAESEAAEAEAAGEEAARPARPKFVPPVRGTADIGYLQPVTKVVGKEVVTTLKVKNLSSGSIALLRADEYWYDKQRTLLPGDSQRYRKPFMPGEIIELEFRTPLNPAFDTNTYRFSHANGNVNARFFKTFDQD